MRNPGFYRNQRIRYRQLRVVVGVNAQHAIKTGAHFSHNFRQPHRHRAAVGIAQAKHVGARVLGGFQRLQRIRGVGVIAIEKCSAS